MISSGIHKKSDKVPVITSFAMKEEDTSPGLSGEGGANFNQIVSPKDVTELLSELKSEKFSKIRYSAYRTAIKLDTLQKGLCLDIVRLGTVVGVFHQHGLGQPLGPVTSRGTTPNFTNLGNKNMPYSHGDIMIEKQKAADILSGIFFAAGKGRTYYQPTLDVLACTEASLVTAMSLYGVNNGSSDFQSISAKALKVFCVLLCEGRLIDKFCYLYQEFSSGKAKNMKFLTRGNLSGLLRLLCKLSTFLGESKQFGQYLVDAAVSQCFQGMYNDQHNKENEFQAESNPHEELGVTEEVFMGWTLREPQVIVWVSTFYRLSSAQNVRHNVSCVGCKIPIIKGLRYQCLRCLSYDLCQNCFFHGVVSRYHKLWHPMQEYCTKGTRRDATKALLKVLSNHLSLSNRRNEKKNKRRAKQLASNLSKKQLKEQKAQTKTVKLSRGQRYLPHEPNLEMNDLENGKVKDSVDYSFKTPDSSTDQQNPRIASQNYNSIKFKKEDDPASTTILRQEGNAIIATDHQFTTSNVENSINLQNRGSEEEQAKLFNSIVIHLEEQNNQIMKKLQILQNQQGNVGADHNGIQGQSLNDNRSFNNQHPLDSCQNMQHQLERLKGLVDNIFGSNGLSKNSEHEYAQVLRQEDPAINESGINTKHHGNDIGIDNSKRGAPILPNQLVESTPLCNFQKIAQQNTLLGDNEIGNNKLLSRSTIHNEFSPIIPKGRHCNIRKRLELGAINESITASDSIYSNKFKNKTNSIIFPESEAVDNLLQDYNTKSHLGELSQTTRNETSQYENINSLDSFPFSRMSLNELTSLLVKTGKIIPNGDSEYFPGQEISPPYNVSRLLEPKMDPNAGNTLGQGEMKTEMMEELDSLMLRLENVFEAYHCGEASDKEIDKIKRINSVHLQQLQKEQDPMIISQIVSEIVDQIHSFNYHCLGAARTQSHPSSSPSIARSEGDGLSSPEPPVLSTSTRSQCVN